MMKILIQLLILKLLHFKNSFFNSVNKGKQNNDSFYVYGKETSYLVWHAKSEK